MPNNQNGRSENAANALVWMLFVAVAAFAIGGVVHAISGGGVHVASKAEVTKVQSD
jgi:hypothetical protein